MRSSKISFSPEIPSMFAKGSFEMTEDQRLRLDASTQIKGSDSKIGGPGLSYGGPGMPGTPGTPGTNDPFDSRFPITPVVDLGEPRHFFDYVRCVYKRRWLTGAGF